jgi:hypothetical protein
MSSKSERCSYAGGIPIKTHFYFAHVLIQYLKTILQQTVVHFITDKVNCAKCVQVILAANGNKFKNTLN